MTARRVWVVEVRYEDDDTYVYGPYTQRQAERVEKRLLTEAEAGLTKGSLVAHPRNVSGAGAMPLCRYEDFLPIREIRRAVREADEEATRDD